MTTLEEKIKLAQDVGLNNWANARKMEAESVKEIEAMTKLNFKPISILEIEKTLKVRYWGSSIFKSSEMPLPLLFLITGAVSALVATLVSIRLKGDQAMVGDYFGWAWFSVAVAGLILGNLPLPRRAKVQRMDLSEWTDNLPLGAFHAIKEAKAAGLGAFSIYYPCTEKHDRLKKDPIIIGLKELIKEDLQEKQALLGQPSTNTFTDPFMMMNFLQIAMAARNRTARGTTMYEVHSWDDGKVID